MYGGNKERAISKKRDALYHAARRDLCILITSGRSPGLWCVSCKYLSRYIIYSLPTKSSQWSNKSHQSPLRGQRWNGHIWLTNFPIILILTRHLMLKIQKTITYYRTNFDKIPSHLGVNFFRLKTSLNVKATLFRAALNTTIRY